MSAASILSFDSWQESEKSQNVELCEEAMCKHSTFVLNSKVGPNLLFISGTGRLLAHMNLKRADIALKYSPTSEGTAT